MDEVNGARGARLEQLGFEVSQVGGDEWLHVGVGAHRVEPLELPHLGGNLRRDRHRHVWEAFRQKVAEAALMAAVHVGVDEADGDGLVGLVVGTVGQHFDQRPCLVLVEWAEHRPVCCDAFP